MTFLLLVIVLAVVYFWFRRRPAKVNIDHLPKQFIVFDLETAGLDPGEHEIIEIGAIRVNRESNVHDTFQSLVKPNKKVSKKITEITGITQSMVDAEGDTLSSALRQFHEFIGDLALVSFNSDFDIGFIHAASRQHGIVFNNDVSCALKMARRAWPGRSSYRLASLAKDGSLSDANTHRALGDCQRALIVYTEAASRLGTVR